MTVRHTLGHTATIDENVRYIKKIRVNPNSIRAIRVN